MSDWIEWKGGACPVDDDTKVWLKFRGGGVDCTGPLARRFYWCHDGGPSDIIAYRLAEPEKAKPTGHPHAELMAQYAEDAKTCTEPWKLWQKRVAPQDAWVNCTLHPVWTKGMEYRRRPRTIKIGDREVPEPLREAPADGTKYWVLHLLCSSPKHAISFKWTDHENDRLWLASGLVHLTAEAATAHAEALIALSAKGCDQ